MSDRPVIFEFWEGDQRTSRHEFTWGEIEALEVILRRAGPEMRQILAGSDVDRAALAGTPEQCAKELNRIKPQGTLFFSAPEIRVWRTMASTPDRHERKRGPCEQ